MLSNIAYIINARLVRVFSRAHHTAISEHLPRDFIRGADEGGRELPHPVLLLMSQDIDIKADYV